ncbi:MAG: agmatine deiminase family protein [Planctomycetota bacterium]|nr:MAG: agmatine deiminase family protein [Planctomycetota bacterium]
MTKIFDEIPQDPDTQALSPAQLGFRHPAEWEEHESTWIAWPHQKQDWPGKFGPVPWVFADIVRHLSFSERVDLIVPTKKKRDQVAGILVRQGAQLANIRFHVWKTDRGWLRDSLPSFVVRPGVQETESGEIQSARAAICWQFNAWSKYENHTRDAKLPKRLTSACEIDRFKPIVLDEENVRRVVLEGGAIDTNGRGVLMTTEECLLSDVQCRNKGMGRLEYEQLFAETLGIHQTIWLDRGIAGDDTHGHVDDIARFVAEATVLTMVEPDKGDINHEPLAENLKRLKAARVNGTPLKIVELPMPAPVIFEDQRLPASYANFYIANKVVLVPTFNDPNDRTALGILTELFPDREVRGIHALDLVWGLGTLHCLAHEMPAEPKPIAAHELTEQQPAIESDSKARRKKSAH